MIQLCLSIQNSLGFTGEFNARKFAGKFSWLVLQLRNTVVLVTMAANMKVPGPTHDTKSTPLDDPGMQHFRLNFSKANKISRGNHCPCRFCSLGFGSYGLDNRYSPRTSQHPSRRSIRNKSHQTLTPRTSCLPSCHQQRNPPPPAFFSYPRLPYCYLSPPPTS